MDSTDEQHVIDCETLMLKEIDLIQSCITRMASNSFYCKGWALAIVVAIVGISSAFNSALMIPICCLAIVLLWIIDANYLFLERMYRRKYNAVIQKRMSGNMDKPFDLNPNIEIKSDENKKRMVLKIMFTWSELMYPMFAIVSSSVIIAYCVVI